MQIEFSALVLHVESVVTGLSISCNIIFCFFGSNIFEHTKCKLQEAENVLSPSERREVQNVSAHKFYYLCL